MAPTLTTPAELTDWLRLDDVDLDDVDNRTAELLLELAEALVRDDLELALDPVVDDVVELDSDGGKLILLPELAVVDVTLVRELATSIANGGAWASLEAGVDYELRTGTQRRRGALYRLGAAWPEGAARVEVTYSHGYDATPGSGPGYVRADSASTPVVFPALPGGIRTAVLRAAARGYTNPTQLRQESIGRWAGTYADAGLFLSAADKALLDPFRKVRG